MTHVLSKETSTDTAELDHSGKSHPQPPSPSLNLGGKQRNTQKIWRKNSEASWRGVVCHPATAQARLE